MTEDERSELIAYLDGELDRESARRMEARIANDADVAREAKALRESWGLLDYLEAPSINPELSQRTIEIATRPMQVQSTASAALSPLLERWTSTWLLLAVGFITCLLSFSLSRAVSRAASDPLERTVARLSLWERLDDLRAAGSIEFLQKLHDSKALETVSDLASADSHESSAGSIPNDVRWKAMTPSERRELLGKQQAFEALRLDQQREIEQLAKELRALPESTRHEYAETMERYLSWRETLSPKDREALDQTPVGERINAVRARIDAQSKQLVADLKPLTDGAPSPGSVGPRPRNDGGRQVVRQASQELQKSLAGKLSRVEEQLLAAAARPQDRAPLLLLFAAAHQVAIPLPLVPIQNRMMASLYDNLKPVHRAFDTKSEYAALTPDQKQRLLSFLIAALPHVDKVELARVLEEDNLPLGDVRLLERFSAPLYWLVVAVYYFAEYPGKAPAELKKSYPEIMSSLNIRVPRNRPPSLGNEPFSPKKRATKKRSIDD